MLSMREVSYGIRKFQDVKLKKKNNYNISEVVSSMTMTTWFVCMVIIFVVVTLMKYRLLDSIGIYIS